MNELDRKSEPLAPASARGEAAPLLGSDPAGRGAEHGLRGGTGAGGEDSRDTRPDRATRFVETTQGILSYAELAPLLADRVAIVEAAIVAEEFAASPVDDHFILHLHQRICGDLVPEWAGKWRDIEVCVGNLHPALPHQIPMLMRDYALDLQARWNVASSDLSSLTLELLAFAEGRFLTIHPFRDFNGRTIRLLLTEIVRRLELPKVTLTAEGDEARRSYFLALEAADQVDWTPLVQLWQQRIDQSILPTS